MVVGNRVKHELREGSGAFVPGSLWSSRGYNTSFFSQPPLCGKPFHGFRIRHFARTKRPITLPNCCQNLGYEEDEGMEIEEFLESQWDFEIDEDDIVEIEPSPSLPNLNVVTLVGRLGADPKFKVTSSGKQLCTFSMAVTHDYDPTDTDEDKTSWFDIEIWGSLAKAASRARKGVRVGVSGSLGLNCWTGRDGFEREDPIIRATTFEILQSRSEQTPFSKNDRSNDGGERPEKSQGNSYLNLSGNLRDLPF